jgi:ATP-grasp ribosomal peptide maturase
MTEARSLSPTVLVISAPEDETARMVADQVRRRGDVRVAWFDLADFPLRSQLSAWYTTDGYAGILDRYGERIDLAAVIGALYRRPAQFQFPASMSGSDRRFLATEARLGVGGVLNTLRCNWVNHPARASDAEFKPAQLKVAQECGLRIPRTVITNNPADAAKFSAQIGGQIIYKTLGGWGLDDQYGSSAVVFTNIVELVDPDDPAIRLTMHQFQERVPKKYEIRATVVGEHCFPVAVHAGSELAQIDWRADHESVTYEITRLPEAIERALREYLHRFGLRFGAFDLIVTPDDEYVWLECNPNGQWGWLEEETGAPISAAIADELTRPDRRDATTGEVDR